ncbi:ribosomal protein S18-alanine N-acetyltransferase [Chloroflexus sp.]|uniref:ribosomal protein S18-alanine N-acetyltransferase n=1 Tax=Chloroflexus sp. TaxID=1904827 RepID=UPI002603CC4C|nr:ribosomal protein S18-alanine N-acetyltransferase [uncultured Chloroflexus sp.]
MYYFIEPMREDDIPAVQEIERQSRMSPWSAQTYRREIQNRRSCRYVVARADTSLPNGATPPPSDFSLLARILQRIGLVPLSLNTGRPLVGYGGIWLNETSGHITTIAVAEAHRRRGVGELILNALIDGAYELEAQYLSLEVRVSNLTAQRLYLKYGFRPVGQRANYYTDNHEDALVMWTDPINTTSYKERLRELRRQLYERLRQQAAQAVVDKPSSGPIVG